MDNAPDQIQTLASVNCREGLDRVISLARLRFDGGTQTRAKMNPEVCAEYAAAMRDGAQFPPVVAFFDGEHYWLADGFHRAEGAHLAGLESIDAKIHHGSQRDARLYAAGANRTHGLRRSNADKRAAVRLLLEDSEWSQWSDREIARLTGTTHPFVAKIRAPKVVTVTTCLPAPGFSASGEAKVDGVHWRALIVPTQSFVSHHGSKVNGDDYLYVAIVRINPLGESEAIGLKRPIRRDYAEAVLLDEGFPIEAAVWTYGEVSDEPDDEPVTLDRRWTWPHLLFDSKTEWIEQRWSTAGGLR